MNHPPRPGSAITPNPHKTRTGLDRIVHAAGYTAEGLKAAVRHEAAFRQEALLAVVLLPLSFWLGRTGIEVALLSGAVLAVLVVELLNSAIEACIDRVSLELHPLAKRAKDYGSAAVALALLWCGGLWLWVLASRLGWIGP